MQRLRIQHANFIEEECRDVAHPPALVVIERGCDELQHQRAQQWRDQNDFAILRDRPRHGGVDIDGPHRHRARHADCMLGPGWYPQGAVRRDDPRAARGRHRHHPADRPGKLRPRMPMRFDPRAVGKFLGHAGKRPRRVLVIGAVGALHCRFCDDHWPTGLDRTRYLSAFAQPVDRKAS
jgi:hypothetical protein